MNGAKSVFYTSVWLFALVGCTATKASPGKDVPQLKQFLSHTDELILIERFPQDVVQFPQRHPDEVSNGIKNHWVPSHINILPVKIQDVHKDRSTLQGAEISLYEDYYVISGYGSPTVGKQVVGQATLDLAELHDLATALTYMEETTRKWRSKAPELDSTVRFASKDGLILSTGKDLESHSLTYGVNIDEASESLNDSQLEDLLAKVNHTIGEPGSK